MKHTENTKLISEKAVLQSEIDKLNQNLLVITNEIESVKLKSNIGNLDGLWQFQLQNEREGVYERSLWIQKGIASFDSQGSSVEFSIRNFIFNPITTELSLTIELSDVSMIKNQFIQVKFITITHAMWIHNSIESTNKNISKYNLRMHREE